MKNEEEYLSTLLKSGDIYRTVEDREELKIELLNDINSTILPFSDLIREYGDLDFDQRKSLRITIYGVIRNFFTVIDSHFSESGKIEFLLELKDDILNGFWKLRHVHRNRIFQEKEFLLDGEVIRALEKFDPNQGHVHRQDRQPMSLSYN